MLEGLGPGGSIDAAPNFLHSCLVDQDYVEIIHINNNVVNNLLTFLFAIVFETLWVSIRCVLTT